MVINRNFLAVVEESREIVDLKKVIKSLGREVEKCFQENRQNPDLGGTFFVFETFHPEESLNDVPAVHQIYAPL